jgi:hypothetical protein
VTRSRWWSLLDTVLIVPLLALLVLFAWALVPTYRIATNPVTAVAVVADRSMAKRSSGTWFDIRYSFVAGSGGEYGGWARVSREVYERTAVGDPLEIEYAADAPENHRVTSDTDASWFAAIGGLATVLLPVVAVAWRAIQRLGGDLRGFRQRW